MSGSGRPRQEPARNPNPNAATITQRADTTGNPVPLEGHAIMTGCDDRVRPWRERVERERLVSRQRCVERRACVLAHEDLARCLTEPPLSFNDPKTWSGYIPPALLAEQHNDSPRRTALVAIATEAKMRATSG